MTDFATDRPMLPPGESQPGPGSLVVFHDVVAGEQGSWAALVDDLAHVLDLAPVYTPIDMHDPLWVGRLLRSSLGAPGPVLVLPRPESSSSGAARAPSPRLLRVVVASGDAPDVVRSASDLSRLFRNRGVRTTVVVVLSDDTVPPIWEGPGHHAAAWRGELQRRHRGADHVRVLADGAGVGRAIRAQGGEADVIVLLWRRVATEGRAKVVRAVLGDGSSLPCLIAPIAWVASLPAVERPPAPLPEATRAG